MHYKLWIQIKQYKCRNRINERNYKRVNTITFFDVNDKMEDQAK